MNPDPTETQSCHILFEFEDDAALILPSEPQYVPLPLAPLPPPFWGIDQIDEEPPDDSPDSDEHGPRQKP